MHTKNPIIFLLAFGLLLLNPGKCSGGDGVETQAEIGQKCENIVQCHLGSSGQLSFCNNGTCDCIPTAVLKPGTNVCYKAAQLIGDPCEFPEQCTKGSTGLHSRCQGGTCQCVALAVPSVDNKRCLPKSALIGFPCERTTQCVNPNGGPEGDLKACLGGTCQCAASAVSEPDRDTCYPTRQLINDPCTIHEQCTKNIGNLTACAKAGGSDTTCQCVVGAVANTEEKLGIQPNTKCYPAHVHIGQQCMDRAQCVGDPGRSSVCSYTGFCDCLSTFIPSADLDNCLAIQNVLGGRCTESQQCQRGDPGPLSECRDGKYCNCTSDAVSEGLLNACYKKAQLVGDSCEKDVQCLATLERSLCLGGSCICMDDAVQSRDNDKCLLRKKLDQECVDHNQCRHMGQAICSMGGPIRTCQCDQGQVRHPKVENKCIRLAGFIGEGCSEHEIQCGNLKEAHCDEGTKRCECHEGTQVVSQNGKNCLTAQAVLNTSCVETRQCLVKNSLCVPVPILPVGSKQCHCDPDGHVQGKEDVNSCNPIRQNLGDHCNDLAQCENIGKPNNVICIDHKCSCPPGTVLYNERCVKPIPLGEPCQTTEQCHAGVNNLTVCVAAQGGENNSEKFCICEPGAMNRLDSCWVAKFVGDSCQVDMECKITISGPVYCNVGTGNIGKCACEDEHESDKTGLMCSTGVVFGSPPVLLVFIAGVISVINLMS